MSVEIIRQEKGFTCQIKTQFWESKIIKVELKENGFIINQYNMGPGLLNGYHYISFILNKLYSNYKPKKFKVTNKRNSLDLQLHNIRKSVANRHGKMYLSKKIKVELDRLRAMANQDWLQIERNCYSFFGPKMAHSYYRAIENSSNKNNNLFINDLKKYKILLIDSEIWSPNWISERFGNSNIFAKKTFLELKRNISFQHSIMNVKDLHFNQILNSTQLNIWALLKTVCEFSPQFNLDDIKKGSKTYAKHFGVKTNLRKHKYLHDLCRYIIDYLNNTPNHKKCSFNGLVRRSIEWHRTVNYSKLIQGLDEKLPCLPMPKEIHDEIIKNKNVKFLSNVGEVVNEGSRMNHCVAGYARYAIRGTSFLFHIEYAGEMATVEIKPNSNKFIVAQARGPFNQINKACKWAEKYFNRILINKENPNVVQNDELPF